MAKSKKIVTDRAGGHCRTCYSKILPYAGTSRKPVMNSTYIGSYNGTPLGKRTCRSAKNPLYPNVLLENFSPFI